MPDGTVRGTFDLNSTPALNKLRELRKEGARVDDTMRKLGDRFESTAGKASASWAQTRKVFDEESTRIEGRVDRLEKRVRRFGRTRATATVRIDGVDKALAQIIELERRVNRLSRQRATPTVSGAGFGGALASTSTGAAGGGGGGGGGLGLAAKLAIGGAALTPALQALPVSATALVGSAAGATLGAATVGGGAAATLGVGLGLTAGVAKPAIKELQTLQKEQTKYNETVRKYGEASKQAAVGRRELAHAEAMVGAGSGVAVRQLSLARAAWRNATAPGRSALYGAIGNASVAFRSAIPTTGAAANIATGASANATTRFASFLAGSQTQGTVLALSHEFARDLPVAERSLQNVTSTVEHLALAARPFFREGNDWVENWTHKLASNTSNEVRVQATMRGLVSETKEWGRLGGATYRTLRDIFDMGRPSGDSMVVSLTSTLDRWDAWIQRNPTKVRSFFHEAQTTTEGVARALTSVAHLLSEMATSLTPIFNRATGLIRVVSSLGSGGTTAASAALYGGYAAFRGTRGGAGPSAGALVATGVLGRPLRRGGTTAARMSGGVLAEPSPIVRTAGGVSPGAYPLIYPGGRVSGLESSGRAPRFARTRSVLGGGLKTVGATLALVGALEAVGKGGSTTTVAQNFASSATLGLVHPVDPSGSRGAAWAARFLGGIPSTTGLSSQQAILERKIARDLGRGFHEGGGILNPFGGTTVTMSGTAVRPGMRGFASAARTTAEDLGRVGPHGQNVSTEVKALLTRWQEIRDTAKEAKRAQAEALDLRSEQHALHISSQLGAAFGTERHAGRSATGAFGDVTGGVLASMRSMRTKGAKLLGENTLSWAHQLKRTNPELAGPIDELTDHIRERFKSLGRDVQVVNGHILAGSKEDWERISQAMSDPLEKARERMSRSFTAIQREAVGALVAMGFNRKGAEAVVAGQEKGGKSATQITSSALSSAGSIIAGATGAKRARGGMLDGRGLSDTVRVPGGMAAPGEGWIANRHTLADMSRATVAMYGLTAQQMIAGESRLHWMGGPGRARGGALAGVRSGVANVAGAIMAQFPGLSVTSTTGGKHATGSLHYLGEAVDLAGPSATMLAAAGWTGSTYGRMLAEGIHNPNLSIKSGRTVPSSYWGEPTWAEHANHIHVGVLGGGGARGPAAGALAGAAAARAIHLRKRTSGLAGVPGMLANAGITTYTRALQGRVNAHLRSTGTGVGGSFAGVRGSGGAPGANERLGREMMLAAGWGANEWPSLKALWTQESGWDANSVNSSSGAYGIPQALGHGHPFALGDARAQIAWGLNYIRGRYGSPSAAEAHERSFNWYARGGRTPGWAGWHASGGDFTTNGPTLIGAGERGRERVSITPLGRGSGPRGHNITVEIGHVTMAKDADIEQVARKVAAKILDALDEAGDGPTDRELIGR